MVRYIMKEKSNQTRIEFIFDSDCNLEYCIFLAFFQLLLKVFFYPQQMALSVTKHTESLKGFLPTR